MSNTRLMVVGFLFANNQVLLIEKQRPAKYAGAGRPVEQAGFLNGIGGVIADGETGIDCLLRKCSAECGITTVASQWIPFHERQDGDDTIIFCKAVLSPKQLSSACSPTDEHVGLYDVDRIFNQKVLPNIHWLVAMACDETHNYSVSIGYADRGDMQHTDVINLLSTPLKETPDLYKIAATDPALAGIKTNAAPQPEPDKAGFVSEFKQIIADKGGMNYVQISTLADKYNVPIPQDATMLSWLNVEGEAPKFEVMADGSVLPVADLLLAGKGSVTGGSEKTSEGGSLETAEPAPASPPVETTPAPGADATATASTPATQEPSTPATQEPAAKASKK